MRYEQRLLDSYIEMLLKRMQQNLDAGREKYGHSWTERSPRYLYRRHDEEGYEFRQATEHDQSPEAALAELADIVNFGLMYLIREMIYQRQFRCPECLTNNISAFYPEGYDQFVIECNECDQTFEFREEL